MRHYFHPTFLYGDGSSRYAYNYADLLAGGLVDTNPENGFLSLEEAKNAVQDMEQELYENGLYIPIFDIEVMIPQMNHREAFLHTLSRCQRGEITYFICDKHNGKYTYSSGDATIPDDSVDSTFTIDKLQNWPKIKDLMLKHFMTENMPAKGVVDEAYNEMVEEIKTGQAGVMYWESPEGYDWYMLLLGEFTDDKY